MVKLREITIDRKSLSEEVIYKYGHTHAGVRELLQNAWDAIKDYEEEFKDKKFKGSISVTLVPRFIVVKDNGIGLASKEVNEYLLRLYGTNKKEKNRAGIFGRGFFAIFKEAKEVFVITQRPGQNKILLKVYPKNDWFICEELNFNEILNEFIEYKIIKDLHGTNIIVIPNTISFNTEEIYQYILQTCQFFEIPLIINGRIINKNFLQAVEEDKNNKAIVDFDVLDTSNPKKRITGCLAYQPNNNMIQAFVYRIKVLNLISPADSVTGYINYNQLKVVPSRDALVQDENYSFFIKVISEQCDKVMKKLSENQTKDDHQALLNYSLIKRDPNYILNIPLYQIVGEREKVPIKGILRKNSTNDAIFFAKKRNLISDRLKRRGYVVIVDFSEKEFEILQIIANQYQINLLNVESPLGRKLAGLGSRYIVPDDNLTSLEKKILEIAEEMVKEALKKENLKVFIIEGDLIDEAEHISGQIWLQRGGKIIKLAQKINNYPTLIKMLLTPIIAHEITHENDRDIHDETFYEIFEENLKKMHEKIIQEFLDLEKEANSEN